MLVHSGYFKHGLHYQSGRRPATKPELCHVNERGYCTWPGL